MSGNSMEKNESVARRYGVTMTLQTFGPPWNKFAHRCCSVCISQTFIVHKHGKEYKEDNNTKKKAVSVVSIVPIARLAQSLPSLDAIEY